MKNRDSDHPAWLRRVQRGDHGIVPIIYLPPDAEPASSQYLWEVEGYVNLTLRGIQHFLWTKTGRSFRRYPAISLFGWFGVEDASRLHTEGDLHGEIIRGCDAHSYRAGRNLIQPNKPDHCYIIFVLSNTLSDPYKLNLFPITHGKNTVAAKNNPIYPYPATVLGDLTHVGMLLDNRRLIAEHLLAIKLIEAIGGGVPGALSGYPACELPELNWTPFLH